MITQKVDETHPHIVVHNTSRANILRVGHVTIVHVIVIIIRVNQILITHPCFEDCLKKPLLAFLAVVRTMSFFLKPKKKRINPSMLT